MEVVDQAYEDKIYKKAQAKAKTTLLWFGAFTVVMFFAGLTSGFLVSRGGGFWVSLQLPQALTYSTVVILLSSVTMVLAVRFVKRNNRQLTTIALLATMLLGLLFGFFQYKGWGEVYKKGYAITGKILVDGDTGAFNVAGEYGKDFTLYYNGKPISIEENQFYYWNEKAVKIDQEEYEEFKAEKPKMVFGSELIRLNKEQVKDKKTKKEKTQYTAVILTKTVLTENQRADLADQGNVSASYFYVLTIAHLIHILFTIIYLLVVLIKNIRGKYNNEEYLQIKLGGYFWHFLGGLWLYLFLFLYLIH